MNQDRIEQLQAFREKNPEDPFLIYALATEYKEENPQKAKSYFDELLQDHPHYIGTYYHAAALYADHFSRDKANEIYQKGIELAEQLKEAHALRELKNAYMNFQFED